MVSICHLYPGVIYIPSLPRGFHISSLPWIFIYHLYPGVLIFLAHQTEIATLCISPRCSHPGVLTQAKCAKNITQNLEINQIWGVVVQEKESNMVFFSRWKFSNPRDDRAERNLGGASVPLSTVIPWVGNFHLEQNPI